MTRRRLAREKLRLSLSQLQLMGHDFSSLMDPILTLQRIKNYVLSTTWPDGSISFHAYNNCLEHQGKKHRFILEHRLARYRSKRASSKARMSQTYVQSTDLSLPNISVQYLLY